jgi:hypothetical protein
LQSKKAGPNALPFLSSLSAKSHLDEMNSHVTVGAARGLTAIGLMLATTAMPLGESSFLFLEKLVFPEDFALKQ